MTMKKLAVPFLTLTLAAFGCSSSTTPTSGTGGAGGVSATGGGAGATATGTGGTAGTSATGTGGTAGTSATGTGGTAGASATGTGGTAGGAGAAGTGGAAGGAGTHGGGGVAGTTGGAGITGGAGAGGAKADAGVSMADCTVTDSVGTDVLTAQVFCQNQLQYCSGVSGVTLPYSTQDACVAAFTANTNSVQKHCESYHLCWGVEGITNTSGGAKPGVHCPHTMGIGLCQADAGN